MQIRQFRHSDRAPCAAIYELAWQEIFPGNQRPISVEDFDNETQGEHILVAEEGNKVVGFASVWTQGSFLHHLHVDPRYRRRGAGSALLKSVVRLADSDVSLKCQIDNVVALKFYKRRGFEETGERGSDRLGEWTRLVLRTPAL